MISATCPACGHVFDTSIGKKGLGAAYMAGRYKLGATHMRILGTWATWIDAHVPLAKEEVRRRLPGLSVGAFGARVSELLAVGMVSKSDGATYLLNRDEAWAVLKRGGVLREEPDELDGVRVGQGTYGNAQRRVQVS